LNRLGKETSPYLLQHAHNPVDWYPWGEEAFARARAENRPVLLSVGYSACHWCHVMERESFEDADTARVMNDLFVNVKVDREERPDVDSIYMQAVQAMNGHGGWPMTVFLTPELVPFWAGTYFPPQDRHGMPSFRRVLQAVADAYGNRPEDVQRVATSMREMYTRTRERARSSGTLTQEHLARAARSLMAQHDRRHGGFGEAPKFPQPMAMEFLLQQWARTGDEGMLEVVRHTFRQMARGGIYDQIGGGFARYSVDERWLVPHFEKMLYDNALLLRVAVHLVQANHVAKTGDDEPRRVAREIVEWLQREMTDAQGGFYSTLDADSEGEEGKFYLWDEKELRELLGPDATAMMEYWGVTAEGNFEGRNILTITHDSPPRGVQRDARQLLYDARARRVWPGKDTKILASWNGLMLRAVAEAARVLDEASHRILAVKNGEFLFRELVRDDRVFRAHKDGVTRIAGFLEDYAAVGLGALALHELTFDRVWLDRARTLAGSLVKWFWDDETQAFYDTASDAESLVTRPRDLTDNATPSGTSLAAELLLRLGDLLGDTEMTRRATFVLETVSEPMARYPLAFGHALTASDIVVHGATEVALVGDPRAADFKSLQRAVSSVYVPSLIVAGGVPGTIDVALLRNRPTKNGAATAYVCRGFMCDAPSNDPTEVQQQLLDANLRNQERIQTRA
jgi:uncharacterized protein